jgi:hypothetical protein
MIRLLTDVMTRPDWVFLGEHTGGIKKEISVAKLWLLLSETLNGGKKC